MIRKMQITDYNAVYNLWLANKGMGLNDVDDSESGIARFLVRNPDTCFVAERNGKLIGVIMAGNDGRRGFIYQGCACGIWAKHRWQRLLGETRLYSQNRSDIP